MAGTVTYALHPFVWDTSEALPRHRAPDGGIAMLDLRTIAESSAAAQGSSNRGFFAFTDPAAVPSGAVVLGQGYAPELVADAAMRSKIKTALGLAQAPAGATLADCLADVMGAKSDPVAGVKPLMPAPDGTVEIQLAGHSRIWSAQISGSAVLGASPTGHAGRIRDRIRLDIDTINKEHGDDVTRKVLGAHLLGLGYQRQEVESGAPGKKAEWQRLQPQSWSKDKKDALSPKKPSTTLTETWPTNSAITSGQVYTWTVPRGGLEVVGGKLRATANFAYSVGRCATAVSSANHFSQLLFYAIGQPQIFGPAVRLSSDGGDYYWCAYNTASSARRLYKSLSGTLTQLDTGAYSFAANDVFKIDVVGSTLTGIVTGETNLAATDSSISGGVNAGVSIFNDTNAHSLNEWGTVVIDDGLPPAPVAAFSGTPLTGTAPLSVAFTYSGTGGAPDTYAWQKKIAGGSWVDFEGAPTAANPTEVFTAGVYDVRVTVSNAGGSDTFTRLNEVTVTAPAAAGSGHTRRTLLGLG